MIATELTEQISARVEQLGISESTLATLRQEYPKIHFTYCMDDDIPNNTPFLEREHFNLYLVDGREHCLCLTSNPEVATGIVLAEIIDD